MYVPSCCGGSIFTAFSLNEHVSLVNTFLSGGLSGVGLGLGPGGQPIDATQLNRGSGTGGMGNMGPGGNLGILLNSFISEL